MKNRAQMDLFGVQEAEPSKDDLAEGRRRRDEAMQAVLARAPEDWVIRATQAVLRVARAKPDCFTSDDVWLSGLSSPPQPRALGPVMLGLQKAGLIEPTRLFKSSTRASRHAAPLRIWRLVLR